MITLEGHRRALARLGLPFGLTLHEGPDPVITHTLILKAQFGAGIGLRLPIPGYIAKGIARVHV